MADILPLKHNLEVYEGDFTELEFTAQIGDITGYSVRLSARLTASSRYAIIESIGEVAAGTSGAYTISFTSSDTLGKATSSGLPYDIVLISPEGKAHTDRTGLLTIDARTTALPPEEIEPEGINIAVGGVLVSEKTPTLDFHAEDVTITDVPATDTTERKTDIKINHHILFEGDEKVDTVYTDAGIKVLLEGDGKATLSQDVTVDPWPYKVLTALDSVYTLTLNSQMGIDYIVDYKNMDTGLLSIKLETLEPNPPEGHNPTPIKDGSQIRVSLINTTAQSNVVNVFGYHTSGVAFNYNISTPTTFVLRLGEWRIEESSQLLHLSTPHSTRRTPFEDPEVIKTPITGIAVDPDSALTLNSDERGVLVLSSTGGDIADSTYQRLDANEIDYPEIKKGGVQVLTVEDAFDGDIQLDDYIKKGEDNTYTGVQTFTATTEIAPTEEGNSLSIKRLDDTPLLQVFSGASNNSIEYRKTLREYEDFSTGWEIVNKLYGDTRYVKRDGSWIAENPIVANNSLYVQGTDFFTKTDYHYHNVGTEVQAGTLNFEEGQGITGEFFTIGKFAEDCFEYEKLRVKNDLEGNTLHLAYQGTYGDGRVYYPSTLRQDSNGWFQFEYTGNLQFKPKDKNTGTISDTTLRLGTARADFYHPLYVEGKRVAERTSHHIYNTYSLNDLITPDTESFVEWMTNNPNYTQVQFLNTLFSCTVLGSANWIVSATTSGEDYNGTFPNGYQQIEIHRNGGGSRSFLRAYNKESPTHYFANYKANTELEWKQYAYTDDNVALKDKVSYDNEIQNIDTTGSGVFAEYLGFGSTSAEHTHTFDESGVFWISNLQSSVRNKIVNVVSSNGAELTGISVPFNRVVKFTYSSGIEEIITEASYANVDLDSSPADSTFDGEGFGVPGKTLVDEGTVIQTEITGNYRNNSDKAGDLTINLRTDNGVRNWRFYYTLPLGPLASRKLTVQVDNKPALDKTIRAGETWQCEVKEGEVFDEFFWQKINDGQSTFESIDVSSFDGEPQIKVLKKKFEDKDLISIPIELEEGFEIMVSSVICKGSDGKLKKQPFEYQHENGILRVHLSEVCSGIIIAELIK